jgi:hypothetical protein
VWNTNDRIEIGCDGGGGGGGVIIDVDLDIGKRPRFVSFLLILFSSDR